MLTRCTIVLIGFSLSSAAAADLRDYCPDRPGIGTPTCTIDAGHVSLEVGLADWTRDSSAGERSDQLIFGDVLIRYGLSDTSEIQLGWTGIGHQRDRDRATGAVGKIDRAGDATVALRYNLAHPDGSGLSAAVMPYASLPVGRQPIGAGDWGAGVRMPLADALNDIFSLELVPEIDAAVDEDGKGRHLAYGGVAGIAAKLGPAVTVTGEYQLTRDADPAGHATQQLAGLSLGWQPADDLQLDFGANGGLQHAADVELYLGVSRRF